MENIRNNKTNSKAKFINFCQNQNRNEDTQTNQKTDKKTGEIDIRKVPVGRFFCKQCGKKMNHHREQPQRVACQPCHGFIACKHICNDQVQERKEQGNYANIHQRVQYLYKHITLFRFVHISNDSQEDSDHQDHPEQNSGNKKPR
jgi:hypothetical protein